MAEAKDSKKVAKAKAITRKPRVRGVLSLTSEIIDAVCELVADGEFRNIAFGRVMVPKQLWHRWTTKGNRELSEYADGEREFEALTLYAELVERLMEAEGISHQGMRKGELGPEDERVNLAYRKVRFSKTYNASPIAIDQETGEEMKVDPFAGLKQSLDALGD